MRNPFKPTAGARPPLLIGRKNSLDGFKEALDDGPGAPGLLTIITGPRGVGKTVLLTAAEDFALRRGWVVVSETATVGLISRLTVSIKKRAQEFGDGAPGRRVTAVVVGGLGVTTQLPPTTEPPWRETVTELVTVLSVHETGLLITIDEIHAVNREELTELAAVIQHLIREDLPVGLIVAGIPKAVSELLNEDVSTFLRRADRIDLDDIPIPDVEEAFAATFLATGIVITRRQITLAAVATGGYPFLIQLVGYHVWRRAVHGEISDVSLVEGIEAATRRLGATVFHASMADLSRVDRAFLLTMAEDNGPSRIASIATRLGENTKYVGVYRGRLLDAGVIVSVGHGLLDFAMPHFRQYLRELVAADQD